jgi:hypothetical protein
MASIHKQKGRGYWFAAYRDAEGKSHFVSTRIQHGPPGADAKERAAKAATNREPINYEGAFHAIDWDARGDMFPPLVHWKIENGRFVEYELYACSRDQPNCSGL